MEITQAEKLQTIKEKFKDDLAGFSKFVLREHIKLDTPKFHEEIYDLITSGHQKVAIAAPRGHAKSTIITLAYVLWCALNGKKEFILIVCDTYPQSKLFLDAIKRECEDNDFLKTLYGTQKTDKWSEADIELKCGVRIMAKGAEMKFRGLKYKATRPDLVVIDDLENNELVESKERRAKLERWFNGTLLPVRSKEGTIVYIGTILHDDALLLKVLNVYPGWETKLYAAIENDKPLWPAMYTIDEINQIKEDYRIVGQLDTFMAEYMNNPVSDENREFKREYFKYYVDPPSDLKVTITVDPAISKKEHADYTAIYCQGVDKGGDRYCLEYVRKRLDPYELCEELFRLVDKWRPSAVGVEKVAYQEALLYILKEQMRKRNTFFRMEAIQSRTNKEVRIRGLVPLYRAGAMYHKAEHAILEEELMRFPRGQTDDVIDAQSMQLEMTRLPTQQYQPTFKRKFDSITAY